MFIVILLAITSLVVISLTVRTHKAVHRYRRPLLGNKSIEYPSVSLCIAARDETHALAQSLERALKSDYKKLEILVLDDSSRDDTSLIIKSFASAGVRFVAGEQLPAKWLGKNYAYQILLNEASAEYALFMDVDTVIEPTTISRLMEHVVKTDSKMVSILPRRIDYHRANSYFGTMRYFWEMIVSSPSKPPAASALWVASRKALLTSDFGLDQFALSIRPEQHLAHKFTERDEYSYMIGDEYLGVSFEKRLSSQYQTAIRLYYPIAQRSVIRSVAYMLFMVILLLPIVIALMNIHYIFSLWALLLLILEIHAFRHYTAATYPAVSVPLRTFLAPFLLIQEAVLLLTSVIAHKRNALSWKGRPVRSDYSRRDSIHLNE